MFSKYLTDADAAGPENPFNRRLSKALATTDQNLFRAPPSVSGRLLTHVGVRAHHLKFSDGSSKATNVLPCWLVEASESPHEMTLYLHLHRPPEEGDSTRLQMEIPKEDWPELKAMPQPWKVRLEPGTLLLLTD